MSSSTNFKYSRLVLGTLLLSTLLVGIIDISTAGQHADEPVDCRRPEKTEVYRSINRTRTGHREF